MGCAIRRQGTDSENADTPADHQDERAWGNLAWKFECAAPPRSQHNDSEREDILRVDPPAMAGAWRSIGVKIDRVANHSAAVN